MPAVAPQQHAAQRAAAAFCARAWQAASAPRAGRVRSLHRAGGCATYCSQLARPAGNSGESARSVVHLWSQRKSPSRGWVQDVG
eukprot:2351047-Pyramimonas_sp.AAC.1